MECIVAARQSSGSPHRNGDNRRRTHLVYEIDSWCTRWSWNTDASHIKHGLANAVDSKILLDHRVLERRRAEGREAEPSSDQTERLAKVAGVEQHDAVSARLVILPHVTREHRCHQK